MSERTAPRPYPSLAFRRLRALTILLVLVALVNMVVHLLDRPEAGSAAALAPAAAAPAPAVPPPPPATVAAEAVDDWHGRQSGHRAVVVADLQSGRTTSYGDTTTPSRPRASSRSTSSPRCCSRSAESSAARSVRSPRG